MKPYGEVKCFLHVPGAALPKPHIPDTALPKPVRFLSL